VDGIAAPNDLAPFKGRAELFFIGARDASLRSRAASVRWGGIGKQLEGGARWAELGPTHTAPSDAQLECIERWAREPLERLRVTDMADPLAFNVAPPDLRIEQLPLRDALALEGLLEGADALVTRVPDLTPKVLRFFNKLPAGELPTRCDTAILDVARRCISLVWRSYCWVPKGAVPNFVIRAVGSDAAEERARIAGLTAGARRISRTAMAVGNDDLVLPFVTPVRAALDERVAPRSPGPRGYPRALPFDPKEPRRIDDVATTPAPEVQELSVEECAVIACDRALDVRDGPSEGRSLSATLAAEAQVELRVRSEIKQGRNALQRRYDEAFVSRLERYVGTLTVARAAEVLFLLERGGDAGASNRAGLPASTLPIVQRVWLARMVREPELGRQTRRALNELRDSD